MGSTRRVAERMIVERAARCQQIASDLRTLAGRLEAREEEDSRTLADEARQLRALADQVQKL